MDLGNGVEINFGKLTDEQLRAARMELDATGEARGLWVPEGAGSLSVAETVAVPADLRGQLLSSVEEGANLFNGAVTAINDGRRKNKQIPITQAGEYRERAKDWLTMSRVEAAAQLPATDIRPRFVIPRLSQPVTAEEVVGSWKSAANGRLWGWSERMKFLGNWTANQLSGFDPALEDADRLAVIPTAYDQAREGTVSEQKTELERLQKDFPELDAATIFDGSVLGRRYLNQERDWRDSYVRGITLKPAKVGGFDYVPNAGVRDDGDADVLGSIVDLGNASRLRVR